MRREEYLFPSSPELTKIESLGKESFCDFGVGVLSQPLSFTRPYFVMDSNICIKNN